MPIHDYLCVKCEAVFEVIIPVSKTDDTITCPDCGEELQKIMASPYFVIN